MFSLFKSSALLIDLKSDRTLKQIYEDNKINPEIDAVVLVLTDGKRIPISRIFDDIQFNKAISEIANHLKSKGTVILGSPEDIAINNVSIHHFETMQRNLADDIESFYLGNQQNPWSINSSESTGFC